MSLRIWCKRRQQRPLHMVITRNASIQSQGFSRCHNASLIFALFFFFSSRRRHTMYIGDWSSDVCSSDLAVRTGDDERRQLAGLDRVVDERREREHELLVLGEAVQQQHDRVLLVRIVAGRQVHVQVRSEERRVGKECRYGWSTSHSKKYYV